jgi:methyl-accepting chemotaxis protein
VRLNRVRVVTQLWLGFGVMALMIVLLAGVALLQVAKIDEAFDVALEQEYPAVVELYEVEGNVNEIARAVRNVLLADDKAVVKEETDRIAKARARIGERFDKLKASMAEGDAKAQLDKLSESRAAYGKSIDKLLALEQADKAEEARAFLRGEMRSTQGAYLKQVDEAIAFQGGRMKAEQDAANVAVVVAKRIAWGLGIGALLVAALLAATIVASITRPLREAVAVARAVAGGDLGQRVHVEGTNETAQLLQALEAMQDSLAKVVGEVRRNADSVATASAQIAQGTQDLSQRTEEQAGALEETAASMEQLGSTVKQNADNAKQANQLALKASTVAVEGGQVVGEVVETMKGIDDASKRIADIISVIDGIAFQTNILALNAAVEAARAGEQGRGFAVVAGEVRSLAQRSAEAAKEIKGLINASVERVGRGTMLVDKAGATMTSVVDAIKRVTDLMGEISAASTEQSAGVVQVGEAVGQMDKTTQQNAALVEESAAASDSLRQQAQQLVQLVAVFKLGHGDDARAPAAALPAAVRATPAAAPAAAKPAQRRAAPRAPAAAKKPAADRQAAAQTAAVEKATADWEAF